MNIVDTRFKGIYTAKIRHNPDINNIIKRAHMFGVKGFIFTARNLEISLKSLEFVE